MSFHFSKFTPLCGMVIVTLALLSAIGCGDKDKKDDNVPANIANGKADPDAATPPGAKVLTPDSSGSKSPAQIEKNRQPVENLFPHVRIETSLGDIVVELNREKSRITVENFLDSYVDRGFYEGTVFHYVEKDYMAIGGSCDSDLKYKETRTPVQSEAHNGLKNVRGTISLNRDPDRASSGTSEFFFNLADNPALDHKGMEDGDSYGYCVFGRVVEGMDVLDKIANTPVTTVDKRTNVPVTPIVIKKIQTVD